ncbi:MAG: tRNA (guanine-N1)-methyltransferase [Flavobacteriaceae bacterium]|nr:tRNA (guanine-N1)-methyltransferase [Flavobacteriaceae bacterium]
MKQLSLICVVLIIGWTASLSAQQTTTLDEQFTDVIDKSNRYEDYKVVKIYKLNNLRKNVKDSIAAIELNLQNANAAIAAQRSEIDTLKNQVSQLQSDLTTSRDKEDGIELFGSLIKKSTYKLIMWTLIGILALIVLYLLFKFRTSNSITKAANLKLAETEDEFESHRQRALEREQQLRRKLQDEINKNK